MARGGVFSAVSDQSILRTIAIVIKNKKVSGEHWRGLSAFRERFAPDVLVGHIFAAFCTTYKTWNSNVAAATKREQQSAGRIGDGLTMEPEQTSPSFARSYSDGSPEPEGDFPVRAAEQIDSVEIGDDAECQKDEIKFAESVVSRLQERLSRDQDEIGFVRSELAQARAEHDRLESILQRRIERDACEGRRSFCIEGPV
jgi:hypothetical protein